MEGRELSRKWKSWKQRMGLKAMGCCGATWSPTSSTMTLPHSEPNPTTDNLGAAGRVPIATDPNPTRVGPTGMNLAMALAAERNSRGAENMGPTEVKTLMRLIEETEGVDWNGNKVRKNNKRGCDDAVDDDGGGGICCCVCMERSKGAAFIPCGHTYCRVCSRELWVNRGSCPLCNRPILEILDIF